MGTKYPLLIRLWGLGERHELSRLGPCGAPAENGFIVGPTLFSADRRSLLLTAAGDSKFFTFLSRKVRDIVPLSPNSGVPVPLVPAPPRKLRLRFYVFP